MAKRYHGPFLVVADRIDRLYEYCCEHKIGWQFDPQYTRMIPAHCLVEIDQVGCPDPNPRYHRFFTPDGRSRAVRRPRAGAAYVRAAFQAIESWIARVPGRAADRRALLRRRGQRLGAPAGPAGTSASWAATRISPGHSPSTWAAEKTRPRRSAGCVNWGWNRAGSASRGPA